VTESVLTVLFQALDGGRVVVRGVIIGVLFPTDCPVLALDQVRSEHYFLLGPHRLFLLPFLACLTQQSIAPMAALWVVELVEVVLAPLLAA
jgi:hypothetical protein